ncbi:MAG: T9SS type A sorting domain-containing protein [Lewinellaceae bacterium]|nr:T9SS type A sorting domain-containing protein [Lewinellaceae bacterium]
MKQRYYKYITYVFIFQLFFKINLSAQSFEQFSDCENPFKICKLGTYKFDMKDGFGAIQDIRYPLDCADVSFKETNSKWIAFTSISDGVLTFTIYPDHQEDDIDFIIFKNDHHDCQKLIPIRCMTAGKNIGEKVDQSGNCLGEMGLSVRSVEEFERSGCDINSQMFLKMLKVQKGVEYLLLVNNFDSEEGFSITFEGDIVPEKNENCECKAIPIDIIALYPNPTIDRVNVDYVSKTGKPVRFELVDIDGKEINQWTEQAKLGQNTFLFHTESLTAGTYILMLKQDDFITTKQFIKK